jgi:DNA-binding transcriptional regulator YbjK
MKRKVTDGAIKNKERTKKKFIDAVGKILKTKGYSALKVNDIAAMAGLDKKLIYDYFGGVDRLIDEYISTQDFWSNVQYEEKEVDVNDGGQSLSKALLLSQFDYVFQNRELQKIILWGLSEKRRSLKQLADKREEEGEVVFKHICDPHFGDKAHLYRAITALLVSGIYYLDIYATINNCKTFCGLDLSTQEGRVAIEDAIKYIIDTVYSDM